MKSTGEYYWAMDILKFSLSVLIVAAHTHLFVEYPFLSGLTGRFSSIAIPSFFAMSAFFLFKKIFVLEKKDARIAFSRQIKRLMILFSVWYVLMLPLTFHVFFSTNWKGLLYMTLLGCAMWGYWFIKALIINSTVFFYSRRKYALIVLTAISFVVYLYCSFNNIYHYNSILFNINPYYSFYYHLAYFSTGVWLAYYHKTFQGLNNKIRICCFLIWIAMFFAVGNFPSLAPIYRLCTFPLIFPIIYREGDKRQLYSELRNMSTIIYMVQFILIISYNRFCEGMTDSNIVFDVSHYSVTRFIVVLSGCIFISLLILKFEKKPHLAFLKYLH